MGSQQDRLTSNLRRPVPSTGDPIRKQRVLATTGQDQKQSAWDQNRPDPTGLRPEPTIRLRPGPAFPDSPVRTKLSGPLAPTLIATAAVTERHQR